MKRAYNYKAERNEEIYNRRKAGETFAAIARSLGINRSRARQVFDVEERTRRDYLSWAERNSR